MKRERHRRQAGFRRKWGGVVAPIALSALVTVAGTGLSIYQTRKASSPASSIVQKVDAKKEALPSDLNDLLPAAAIQELALKAGGSPASAMALENHSGVLVYAVDLRDGAKLAFNATSGDTVALQDDTETVSQAKKTGLPTGFAAAISFEEAQELAQNAFPGDKINQIKLDADENIIVLRVAFTGGARVDIDAANGDVIRVTAPGGAIAEKPKTETVQPSTDSSEEHSSESDSRPSAKRGNTSSRDDKVRPTDQADSADKRSGNGSIQITGTLVLANGIYTVTVDDVTYVIRYDKDISDLVDKDVRIVGRVSEGNVVKAANIRLQRPGR